MLIKKIGIILGILLGVFIGTHRGLKYMTWMPGDTQSIKVLAEPGFDRTFQAEIENELLAHVKVLSEDIGERHTRRPKALFESFQYIKNQFEKFGYVPSTQEFFAGGHQVFNIEVEQKGSSRPNEIIVVGAHYDTFAGTPGANDNASGMAVMLSLARQMQKMQLAKTLRFVAFVNEEPPWYRTDKMGSYVYAKRSFEAKENIVLMISLETMGYFSDQPDSQKYPFPVGFYYPSIGDFIAFVSDIRSRETTHRLIESYRKNQTVASQGATLLSFLPGVGWSDHASFWEFGYHGVMITDTAPFRYPYYHKAGDTPDKLDMRRLAEITIGLKKAFLELLILKDQGSKTRETILEK